VTDDGGRDLGETIIDANDINSPEGELFIKFFSDGIIGGPFYELGTRSSRVKPRDAGNNYLVSRKRGVLGGLGPWRGWCLRLWFR
jgi:hypothetical protein